MTLRRLPLRRWQADLLAIAALVLGILLSARDLLLDPVRAGQDAIIFFWPTFAFLGERLRAGDIPGWNPHQFAGVPFAADPESGWMYLPAMFLFAAFPLGVAIRLYMVVHLLLAGLGAYALGRTLGLSVAGALASGWAFALSGLLSDRARCCYAHVQVATWIPWALLGVELAYRARGHRARLGGWVLGGFAISQMLGGWLGQGAYYGLLVVASYVVFRVTLPLPRGVRATSGRVGQTALHGLVPLAIGIGLAVPGILPRLAYQTRSNLAGGYTGPAGWAAELGGWSPGSQIESLLSPSGWYVGAAVVPLTLIAIVTRGNHPAVAFFTTLTVATFVLGLDAVTPLHQLFALLPRFEETHAHLPERIAIALAIGPAMLAGAAVTHAMKSSARRLVLATSISIAGFGLMTLLGIDLPPHSWLALIVVLAVLGVGWLGTRNRPGSAFPATAIVPAILALVVAVDLGVASQAHLHSGGFARVDLADITEPNATAQQLSAYETAVSPRFFGFAPWLSIEVHGQRTLYRHQFQDPLTARLLVNNQATLWGLADVQGYNPLQLARYVEFINALNGLPQEYHGAYVLPSGLDSPLLPLLGSEFIVVPRQIGPDQPAESSLVASLSEVWGNDQVRILHDDSALPRAWIVHEAITTPVDETLSLMMSGTVDFRRTVVLDQHVTAMTQPDDPAASRATIASYASDALTVETEANAPGMLVLSEIYDDGWRASVDGEPVEIHRANYAFRAVPIPAGAHSVRLTYTPPSLALGLAIFAITGTLLLTAFALAARRDGVRFPVVPRIPMSKHKSFGRTTRNGASRGDSSLRLRMTDFLMLPHPKTVILTKGKNPRAKRISSELL